MRLILLVLTLTASTLAGAAEIARLSVPGMSCPVCPITVRKALTRVPGVLSASVDYDSRSAQVSYDPARVDTAALLRATADAGYPSTLIAPPASEAKP